MTERTVLAIVNKGQLFFLLAITVFILVFAVPAGGVMAAAEWGAEAAAMAAACRLPTSPQMLGIIMM